MHVAKSLWVRHQNPISPQQIPSPGKERRVAGVVVVPIVEDHREGAVVMRRQRVKREVWREGFQRAVLRERVPRAVWKPVDSNLPPLKKVLMEV